ncbi:MAG: hypothetical protein UZ11_BCD004000394 [Bacteroidetes bacterium OLB11]|nr:MAG: hypothetical protein UZ11_BCD004000394 [Bacteroidetes bacterium OLB11]
MILPVLAGIFFTACNEGTQAPSQSEIDQQVEAKVKEATDKLKADCDAQIMNAAQQKKDSILVRLGKATTTVTKVVPAPAPKPAPKPTTAPPKTKEPTKEAPVQNVPQPKEQPKGIKSLSDQNKQESGKSGGIKSLSDQNKAQEANKQQGGGGLKSLRDNK